MMGWATGTALAVSVLIVLVLILRKPVARQFGARAAYALWLAPLVRAILPPLPSAPLSVATPSLVSEPRYQLITTTSTGNAWSLSNALIGIWIAGALVFLAIQLVRHNRFLAKALSTGKPLLIDGIGYDVVSSPAVEGPMATGLVHPLILVPSDFAQRFNPEQQGLALLHERLHHRRGDIWASAAALIVTALLWFNPLAHIALGAFRRDMEAACDATLVSTTGQASVPLYAETILRSAAHPVPRSLCALTAIDELKGRLTMLTLDHGRRRRLAGLLIAGATITAGVALAAPSTTSKTVHEMKEVKVIRTLGGKDPGKGTTIANCPGPKIEANANSVPGKGKKSQSTIVLCGDKGASNKELAEMVDGAVKRIQSDNEMAAAEKAQLISQLRAKATELRAH